MATFESFQQDFFAIFTSDNFYENKTYLEYVSEPQTNDEDNIVDTKIILPLLTSLGFDAGDIAKNITNKGKDNSRPDFQVRLSQSQIRCFLVEDKNTAYDLTKPDPLQQLVNYAASRGYELGLICNGKLLLGWDISNQNAPNSILYLDIEQIIQTYTGQSILSQGKTGVEALTPQHLQGLKALYRQFSKQNFEGLDRLIDNISRPEEDWKQTALSQEKTDNFNELLIDDLRKGIELLEEDVLYQLNLLLKEYEEYCETKYLPNGNGNGNGNNGQDENGEDDETAPKILQKLRKEILNYLRAMGAGFLGLDDYSWVENRLNEFTETPKDSIEALGNKFLKRLQKAQKKRQKEQEKQEQSSESYQQLGLEIDADLLPPISQEKQKKLGINVKAQKIITKLDKNLVERLRQYEEIVLDWKAWQARQTLTYDLAIKTHQYFTSWRNLITKTVLQGADETKLKEEFARQTAYVYVVRLLMVRICEDKGLINRKFSDGGFKQWIENVVPQYLDFAEGRALDYLLELSYYSAQSIYAHFFNKNLLFNWYRISRPTLIRVLHILNRFNLQTIDSDIIGMVYGRYVIEGKHEQGRYFTPKNVVEYILDNLGYTADNPEIRDKTLLDLAGGSGSFLVHAAQRLIDSYRSPRTGEIPIDNVPFIIEQVKQNLYCLDINPFACYLAETNLLIQVIDLLKRMKEINRLPDCTIDRFNVYNTDSLLLPKQQEIRTPLLDPVLNLELSTVSQIKTKTGRFLGGFDFIVGNPPYVKADEPGVADYRRRIEASGRFETLYEKWDLFVPFVELACQSVKDEGKIGLIVSRGFQTNNYAELLRDYIVRNVKVTQVDFFNRISLFSDAVVSNTIFFLEKTSVSPTDTVKRILHRDSFEQTEDLPSLSQIDYQAKVFRQFVVNFTLEDVIDLEDICYCSIGMVLNADEKKAKGAFKKDDLISDILTQKCPNKYIDGENIVREFFIDKIRYLEWNTERVPSQIRRATIPELYDLPKILFGMTSYPTYDRGIHQGDGFYVPDSVRICVRWDEVSNIQRLANEPRQMYEISKKRQRLAGDGKKKIKIYEYAQQKAEISQQFDLRYIIAILASDFGKLFLLMNNRDENIMSMGRQGKLPKSRIYPDDLKEFPIKNISLEAQQPFIEKVDFLITANWEIYELCQLGHTIKFSYDNEMFQIKIDFLAVFSQLNPPCWTFGNAEPQRVEIIGDRSQILDKIKIQNDQLLLNKAPLLTSQSSLVLEYLEKYLPQFTARGLSWNSLLNEGKIPKKDEDITAIFQQCENLQLEISQKIEQIRENYQQLNQMVSQLYEN